MKPTCLSHAEDLDGLTCAAFLRRAKDADMILVTYDEFLKNVKTVRPSVKELYICDLGLRDEVIPEIKRVAEHSRVTIVDHHPTTIEFVGQLEEAGVEFVFSKDDCASVLLYEHMKEALGRDGARLAAYASVSDQFDDGPIASELLLGFDRQFVQYEALLATHALARELSRDFRYLMVDQLSKYAFPHRIDGVPDAAMTQVDCMARLIESLPGKAVKAGNLAYVEAPADSGTGAVAGLLIDALDVAVGICYKKRNSRFVNISLRSRKGLDIHFGELTKELAAKYGGFGGGHMRASGASILHKSFPSFVEDIERELQERQ